MPARFITAPLFRCQDAQVASLPSGVKPLNLPVPEKVANLLALLFGQSLQPLTLSGGWKGFRRSGNWPRGDRAVGLLQVTLFLSSRLFSWLSERTGPIFSSSSSFVSSVRDLLDPSVVVGRESSMNTSSSTGSDRNSLEGVAITARRLKDNPFVVCSQNSVSRLVRADCCVTVLGPILDTKHMRLQASQE